MDTEKKIEKLHLEDGRWAERHSYLGEDGSEVVEMYVEPQRNLALDKRVINKKKEILAEQRIETIRNGEVVDVEVHSVDAPTKLELREHIRKVDNSERGDFVTKDQLKDVMKSVMAPVVEALSLKKNDPYEEEYKSLKDIPKAFSNDMPVFKAQSLVEDRVDETKKKNEFYIYVGLGGFLLAQTGFLIWLMFG